jgi:hypothetical protein
MNNHIKAHNFFVNESGVFVNTTVQQETIVLPAELIQLEMF